LRPTASGLVFGARQATPDCAVTPFAPLSFSGDDTQRICVTARPHIVTNAPAAAQQDAHGHPRADSALAIPRRRATPKKMAGGYLSRPPSEISVALASGGHQRDKKNRTTRGGRSAS
jgi:hypothetical protein